MMKVFLFTAALLVVACSASHAGQVFQAPGPTEADQPAGPSPADQPAGPSPADQPGQPIGQAAGPAEDATNTALARAQHKVNVQALHYGAGVGTAPYYGVPGTDVKGVHNDGRYYGHGYGHRGYYGGYGYGGYGHGRFGYGGYGRGGYGYAGVRSKGAFGYGRGYHVPHHGGYVYGVNAYVGHKGGY